MLIPRISNSDITGSDDCISARRSGPAGSHRQNDWCFGSCHRQLIAAKFFRHGCRETSAESMWPNIANNALWLKTVAGVEQVEVIAKEEN